MQKTRIIIFCGMLAAIGAVLSGPLGFKVFLGGAYSLNVSFGLIPGMIGGILMGPLFGAVIGIITDILKYLLTGLGAYDPFFTFSFAIMCIIPSLIVRNKKNAWRVLIGVALSQVIGSMLLNNLWFYYVYKFTLPTILIRLISPAVMTVPYTLIIILLLKYERLFLRLPVIKEHQQT